MTEKKIDLSEFGYIYKGEPLVLKGLKQVNIFVGKTNLKFRILDQIYVYLSRFIRTEYFSVLKVADNDLIKRCDDSAIYAILTEKVYNLISYSKNFPEKYPPILFWNCPEAFMSPEYLFKSIFDLLDIISNTTVELFIATNSPDVLWALLLSSKAPKSISDNEYYKSITVPSMIRDSNMELHFFDPEKISITAWIVNPDLQVSYNNYSIQDLFSFYKDYRHFSAPRFII